MIEFFIISLATVCDALRDRWVYRRPDVGWWQWHIVKWASFYGLAGYVFVRADFAPWLGFFSILLCWTLWNVVYWYGRLCWDFELRDLRSSGELELRFTLFVKDRI